ncbi:MAG: hypothetical protein DRJ67_12065 [Thermoprotei archaeon]|nr:MAG: hypothetical protein DRJ67_12065 [Thermoprotei archaeon]
MKEGIYEGTPEGACNTTSYVKQNNRIREKLYNKRLGLVSFRVSKRELDMLAHIMAVRGTDNLSEVVREAIQVYYGLLANVEQVRVGNVVIERPIVNLNINRNENTIALDPAILERKAKILEREKRELKEIINYYEREIEQLRRENKELQKMLRRHMQARHVIAKVLRVLTDEMVKPENRIRYAVEELRALID